MVDSWLEKDPEHNTFEMLRALRKEGSKGMWAFTEMELSLLYDILYTKASMIHTWPGYFIRFTSSAAIAASSLLFHFSGRDGHKVDVTVTYALLAGAFLMEEASLLNALGPLLGREWRHINLELTLGTNRELPRRMSKAMGSMGLGRPWAGPTSLLLWSSDCPVGLLAPGC